VSAIDEMVISQSAWSRGYTKTPWWLRMIGVGRQYYRDERRQTYRTPWGEITFGWSGFAVDFGCYESAHLHFAPGFANLFIRLPFANRWFLKRESAGDCPRFGFSFGRDGDTLHLHWNRRVKVLWMPWTTYQISREFLAADGRWLPKDQMERSWKPGEGVSAYTETHPYHYMLDDGEVQHVEATITRERSCRGLYWFSHTGPVSRFLRAIGPKWRSDGIDIAFSEEVGAARGSWKGGCVGCGYEMKPGETPQQTLLRMQRERRFR
jgi:hypothetical protein